MKIGYEVEGRLKGIKTLFINTREEMIWFSKNDKRLQKEGLAQIYIDDLDSSWVYLEPSILKSWKENYFVTVESKVPPTKKQRELINHFMLHLPYVYDTTKHSLMETDSIKFHTQSGDVYAVSIEGMHYTPVIDFAGDKEIPWRE